MRRIVYYVAATLDGFIPGPDGDITGFTSDGDGVQRYLADLKEYDTVIMGRKTYEFGYRFGLQAGQPAYPHMMHYIFSNNLRFATAHSLVRTCAPRIDIIESLKNEPGTDIYLCGGGEFAGWLLDHGQIDVLKIKLNPFIMGSGVKIFGDSKRKVALALEETERFEYGLQIMTYNVIY